jgi:ribonucleoside-triphosphate reductase
MFENGENITTVRTLRNIKKALKNNLENKYDITDLSKVDEFLNIHGVNKERFDFVKTVETIMAEKINDVSIDENSNKNEKTVEGIFQETVAPIKKVVGFDILYRKMLSLYGKQEAKRLSGEMYDLSLGLSDSTNILKVYCWSLDASKIVTIGREFGQLHSTASKRISSYISALCETIHQLSSHLAGAIAVGTFFLDIAHLYMYGKDVVTLEELRRNKDYRKKIENEFQQFVHSVNHLARNGIESPFTNISIFDSVKLLTLIRDMSWYFPFEELNIEYPNDLSEAELKEYYEKYIIDYIMELQDIFLSFFDNGDPIKNGIPYRFPVVTINLSKKKDKEKEIIVDSKFLKKICKKDIYRYNIFVSSGTKIASCCRFISNTEMLDFASQANSFGGGGSVSLGSHRVCTINFMRIALESNSREEFFKILDDRTESAAKILKSHKELINTLTDKKLQMFVANGWINKNRLFSTFGILGIYEAVKLYSKKVEDNESFMGDVLTYFNNKVLEMSKKYDIIGNIEQIPAESFAVRLAKADKIIFGEENIPYKMYANQFIPLWEEASVWERMDEDGKYNKLITGGGIVHIQIGEKITPLQAEKIIKYSVNSGCEHFALNSVWSECDNGHVNFGDVDVCPTCGAKIKEKYTRVVGFFTPVSSWLKERREWEFGERKFCTIN